MEELVVEVPMRTSRKRFAIKDNGICDCSSRGFAGDSAEPHGFFSPENNAGGDTHEH